jgi:hypothetical protein
MSTGGKKSQKKTGLGFVLPAAGGLIGLPGLPSGEKTEPNNIA